ncbi:hypothetical protein [Sulfurimonas sp.]|uniref:hypothetical protein n=1 Tax=Sulfurimonas sp. TaxID=2022749 RepID=UPI002B47A233|nr:hypothetical protein [Sulfurimonas sp.]
MKAFNIIFLFLFLSLSSQLLANECQFDSDQITKQYVLDNTQLTNFEWNNKLKIAKTTIHKSVLQIQYYSCNHFGQTIIFQDNITKDNIQKNLKWLANFTLGKNEKNKFILSLENKKFQNLLSKFSKNKKIIWLIQDNEYSEFILIIEQLTERTISIKISWYIA